jgi:hypothetical protein
VRAARPHAAGADHARGHRLDVGDAECLLGGRHHEQGAAAGALQRLIRLELAEEFDTLGDTEAHREAFQRRPLGAVADDRVAQRRMAWPQHRKRAQHVGVALARDQVRDRYQRRRRLRAPARGPAGARIAAHATLRRWKVGAEVHDTRLAGAVDARELGDPMAVREHQRSGTEAARDGSRSRIVSPGRVQHVAAVHRHDDRHVQPRVTDRLARGHGVVGVDELERERTLEHA